jgi:peptide/nickel transport system substrate-binding protein
MKSRKVAVAALAAVACFAAAACGSKDPAAGPENPSGGTFTMALSADPGALDPAMTASSPLFWMSRFAYDNLVSVDPDGQISPQLASEWTEALDKLTFTVKEGVTCADGSPLTAQTIADNINFVADPANESPLLGAFVPAGATAEASGQTLTVNLAEPAPFALLSLSELAIVCDAGLADRSTLAAATNGSGPYELTEAVPNDHYTFKIREGYTWGQNGATTAEVGMPSEVVVRIIENETTVANMLLAGEVNAAIVMGADMERLDAAGLFALPQSSVIGEQWYNEAEGHVTADPVVRAALAQAVELTELRQVITSGKGTAPTTLSTTEPVACPGDSLSQALPAHDPEAAKAALEAAGYKVGADGSRAKDGVPLKIVFAHDAALGDGAAAAAEFATQAWRAVGFEVEATQLPTDQMQGVLFGTGAWEVAWEPLNTSSPDQLTAFFSGPGVAEGGANFASISNAAYESKVAQASQQMGTAGCADWLAAETELAKANDITVFANSVIKLYGSGAEFQHNSAIIATSIRLVE